VFGVASAIVPFDFSALTRSQGRSPGSCTCSMTCSRIISSNSWSGRPIAHSDPAKTSALFFAPARRCSHRYPGQSRSSPSPESTPFAGRCPGPRPTVCSVPGLTGRHHASVLGVAPSCVSPKFRRSRLWRRATPLCAPLLIRTPRGRKVVRVIAPVRDCDPFHHWHRIEPAKTALRVRALLYRPQARRSERLVAEAFV
jgi:hypothetical protein